MYIPKIKLREKLIKKKKKRSRILFLEIYFYYLFYDNITEKYN